MIYHCLVIIQRVYREAAESAGTRGGGAELSDMSEKVRRGGGAECAALQARVPCGMPSALAAGGCGSSVHCCVEDSDSVGSGYELINRECENILVTVNIQLGFLFYTGTVDVK